MLLGLSIALNLFLIAGSATLWLRSRVPQSLASPEQIEAAVIAPLGPDDRALMKAAFDKRQADVKVARGQYRASLRKAIAIVAQPDLDAQALRAEAEKAKEARARMNAIMVDSILEGVEHMSPEGRQALVVNTVPPRMSRSGAAQNTKP
jgi:uncharacterized membrane protein